MVVARIEVVGTEAGVAMGQTAGHPEVHEHHVVAVELDDQIFRAARQFHNSPARDRRGKIRADAAAQPPLADSNAHDRSADCRANQYPAQRFDFRQFRHRARRSGRPVRCVARAPASIAARSSARTIRKLSMPSEWLSALRIVLRGAENEARTVASTSRSFSLPTADGRVARGVKTRTSASTLGRGWKLPAATVKCRSILQHSAVYTLSAPYASSPGAARIRAATSR